MKVKVTRTPLSTISEDTRTPIHAWKPPFDVRRQLLEVIRNNLKGHCAHLLSRAANLNLFNTSEFLPSEVWTIFFAQV